MMSPGAFIQMRSNKIKQQQQAPMTHFDAPVSPSRRASLKKFSMRTNIKISVRVRLNRVHASSSLLSAFGCSLDRIELKVSFPLPCHYSHALQAWGRKKNKTQKKPFYPGRDHVVSNAILRSHMTQTKPQKYWCKCSLQRHRVYFSVSINVSPRSCFVSGSDSNNRSG